MTDEYAAPAPPAGAAPVGTLPGGQEAPPPAGATPDTLADLRAGAIVVAVLAVVGALLGVVWSAWSGPQQRAFVIAPGRLYPYDEVETRIAADGRYAVLVAAVGLVAALLVWFRRSRNRGVILAAALVAGGLAGAALTWWVGHLTGGGTYDGRAQSTIAHLPLTLHSRGLLLVEPAVAALVYALFVAFTHSDDLGRPDPVRQRLSVGPGSVGFGDHAQHGGRDGDAAGALQQRDLPAQ